jgi:hypothetical protein
MSGLNFCDRSGGFLNAQFLFSILHSQALFGCGSPNAQVRACCSSEKWIALCHDESSPAWFSSRAVNQQLVSLCTNYSGSIHFRLRFPRASLCTNSTQMGWKMSFHVLDIWPRESVPFRSCWREQEMDFMARLIEMIFWAICNQLTILFGDNIPMFQGLLNAMQCGNNPSL